MNTLTSRASAAARIVRRKSSALACATGAAVCALTVATSGQQQEPRPSFRGRVDLVTVDVTVLDDNRRPVRNLTAADFTVAEDRKRRPIVAFSQVDLPPPPGGDGAPWTRTVASDVVANGVPEEGRLVVIVFDWSILFEAQRTARQIARAAVDQLARGDLASVVFTSAYSNGGVPQNFTADRERLLRAIDRPFAPSAGGDPFGRASGECYCGLCIPAQLSHVADTIRDVPKRRKVMLFIGTLFRAYSTDECSGQLRESREHLIDSARLANLTIDTLDPRGLPIEGNVDPGLRFLADETGGRAVFWTNSPETFVAGLLEESSSYYVLGIKPADPESAGRRHELDVRVDRPHVTVHARKAYVTPRAPAVDSSSSAPRPRLDGVLPHGDLPLAIETVPLADVGDGKPGILVILRGALGASKSSGDRPPRVTVAAYSPKGEFVRAIEGTFSRDRMPAGATDDAQYMARLALAPGSYEIRASAEAAGTWGNVFTFDDVPDFNHLPLSASSIVVTTAASSPGAGLGPKLPVQPTLQRTFQRTEVPTAFIRIYERKKSDSRPVTVDAQLVDDRGQQVWSDRMDLQPALLGKTRHADALFHIPVRDCMPGDYLLTINATAGDHEVSRKGRFTVR